MQITMRFDRSQLNRKLLMLQRSMEELLVSAAHESAKDGVRVARQGPHQDRTGALRWSNRWDIVGWHGRRYLCRLSNPQTYASFVEFGTRPHDIWPKAGYSAPVKSLKPGQTRRGRGKGPHEHVVGRGKALRWKDADGEHFAAMVHHPGSKPYPFMSPAKMAMRASMLSRIRAGKARLAAEWSRIR
jgi:hypothetical protein